MCPTSSRHLDSWGNEIIEMLKRTQKQNYFRHKILNTFLPLNLMIISFLRFE